MKEEDELVHSGVLLLEAAECIIQATWLADDPCPTFLGLLDYYSILSDSASMGVTTPFETNWTIWLL